LLEQLGLRQRSTDDDSAAAERLNSPSICACWSRRSSTTSQVMKAAIGRIASSMTAMR